MVTRATTAVLLAALVALSGIPASAAALSTGSAVQADGNETVNVTTGQQLSTVLAVTSDDVQSEVDEAAFETEYEDASEEERAEAIADRAETLRDRAESIAEDYEAATEAYEDGDLTKSEYAQRIAALNARADNLLTAYENLRERADNVSALELRAAGFNATATQAAVDDLDSVSGAGASALLQRFVGQSQGEVEIDRANGLSISVESEDGEQSRELDQPGDDSTNLTVSQSDALDTARSSLSDANGTWVLSGSGVDREDGTYSFAFRLDGNTTEGEAEITVDGSSGEIVSLEEEIEPHGEADDADEEAEDEAEEGEDAADEERDERELALVVADGTVAPNETVTVRALADGEPTADVTVYRDGEAIGTTDADGTVSVTLPESGEVELTAGEGELEFELGDEDEEVYRNLSADTTLQNGTVTVTLRYEGNGVADASVYANGEQVGTTDADGTVTFDVANSTEELEIEVVKGEFEAEFEYEMNDGSLSQTKAAHGSDNESEEADDERDEEETETEETEEPEETENEGAEETEETEDEATTTDSP